jgi:RsiW-degrading membrane proteinase PrsW (M82 family)
MSLSLTSRALAVRRGPAWRTTFLVGLLLWAASTLTLVATGDDILVPASVLLGSFLIPVCCVFWIVEHGHHTTLTPARLMVAFFVAGVLGLLASAVLELWLVPSRMMPNLWVGLIEEAVKALGLLLVGRGLASYRVRDGIILGATVGLGFGAFEAAGYSLSYSVQSGAFSARDLVSEELLRAVIAPFGHGVWTALVGAAAFATAARHGGPAWSWSIPFAYLLAVLLHAAWDASSNAASALVDADAVMLVGALQWLFMFVVAAIGVWLVRRRWRVVE